MRPRIAVITLAVPLLMLVTGPSPSADLPQYNPYSGTFDGYWSLSGDIHILERDREIVAAAGRLTGQAVIQTNQGPVPSFDTECIVFSEKARGGTGKCVWTATSGDEVYVDISSDGPAGLGRARGVIQGGTGRFEEIKGSFQFDWNYSVSGGADATLTGQTLQMRGHYTLK